MKVEFLTGWVFSAEASHRFHGEAPARCAIVIDDRALPLLFHFIEDAESFVDFVATTPMRVGFGADGRDLRVPIDKLSPGALEDAHRRWLDRRAAAQADTIPAPEST